LAVAVSLWLKISIIRALKLWRFKKPFISLPTLKAWQLITHSPSSPTYRRLTEPVPENLKNKYGFFKPTDELFLAWEKTREIAQALKAKIIIFQCPASFTPDRVNIENFKKFFQRIERKNFIFVWEPRGRWKDEEIKSLCREFDLIHGVDPFKQKPVWTLEINYFRLHGKGGYRYKYTDQDLAYLKELCREAPTSYVMFNNLSMWEDAFRFKRLLQT